MHSVTNYHWKKITLAQVSRQQKFPIFLCHKMERDTGWLLKAQLCLLTAEFMFYVTNHLIGQEKGSGPVLYENRFMSGLRGGGVWRDYHKSRNHVFACVQMMPEIRVALFGANPNRKFMDWGVQACDRRTLLVFNFLFSNIVIPPPVNVLKRDELLWCIICNFLCIAGRDRSCRLTLHQQLELVVYITVSFFI